MENSIIIYAIVLILSVYFLAILIGKKYIEKYN